MATYAIGDVQGCFATLQALLDTLAFHPARDFLWFTGDLVNRGPRSLEALRLVRALGERAVTVLGNHDLHLLAVGYGCSPAHPKDTLADVLAAPDCTDLLDWLRQQPLLHYDITLGMTMVHAGLPPQWSLSQARVHAAEVATVLRGPRYRTLLSMLGNGVPRQWSPTIPREERLCYIAACLTRLRYCDASGQLALGMKGPPGTQPEAYLPWFAVPHRASAQNPIVFGHWATLPSCTAPGVHHLDTGCVWGGALTAMCLETGERTSVACRDPIRQRQPD